MKKIALLITIIITAVAGYAQPRMIDKVVAQVGDKIILKSDVEIFYQQEVQKGVLSEDIRCEMLKQLISQKLLLVQAAHDSIIVSDDEIEQELESRIRYFISQFGSEEKMEEFYGKTIREIKDEFRDLVADLMLSQRMSESITGDVTVSPLEVKDFFNKIPKDSLPYLNAEVEYAQIIIVPKPTEEQKQIAKEKTEAIRQRILNGEDFAIVANTSSIDPGNLEAQNGGYLGCKTREEFVPEFSAEAFKLKSGEISNVIETEFGYHIIKMDDRQGDKACLRHIVIAPLITNTNMIIATKKLDSIRTQIMAGNMTFYNAAYKYSTDESSNKSGGDAINQLSQNTFYEIDQLEPEVYYAIEKLKAGDISEVAQFKTEDGKKAVRIIQLKSQTEPHIANLQDDYSKIQTAALSQKKQTLMNTWLLDKMKAIYLRVDSTYATCSQLQELQSISAAE